MFRYFSRNLGPRIFFYTMAAYAAIVVLAATVYVAETYRSEKENILRELKIYQESFSQPLASMLWSMDRDRIDDLLNGIALIPGVVGIRLVDPSSDYQLAAVGQVPRQDSGGENGLFGQGSEIVYREHGQSVQLGRLTLYSANDAVLERIRYRVILIISGAALQVLFLWMVLQFLIKRLISRRLDILTAAVESFDPNRPAENATPLDISGQDELSILGHAFEEQRGRLIDVLGSLNSSQLRLAELNRELEGKVEARTAELAEAKESAEQASRAKSDFLATMSHEMRTPLNAVLGMAYLALQQDIPPVQRNYLDAIQMAARSLLGVISDTLDLSKIEAGRLELERIDFDLDRVLEGVVVVAGHQAREQRLEFSVRVARDVPNHFVGDPQRLGQILLNLAGNAVKFTERGGVSIDITVAERSGERLCLRFAVCDTGIGLSETQIGVIFDAFTQADSTTARRFGGTGLGLSICTRLVEKMGGKLEVESRPGEGSTFRFTACFDAAAEDERVLQLDGLRLLLAGADFTALFPLSAMFERAGAHVVSIDDASRVLGGGDFPFDLLVLDLRAERDGWGRLRGRLPPGSRVLLIGDALSGCTEAEGVGCFSGQITPLSLVVAVRQALGRETVKGLRRADGAMLGRRVLLVEDNPFNQQVGRGLLQARGIDVTVAASGAAALELLARERFDLVLMDIQMPGMSGYEVSEKLRRDPNLETLPIIAMTADATADARQACLDAGMQDYLAKPVEPERLYALLGRYLKLDETPAEAGETIERELAALAELPGLDTRRGLRLAGGDVQLYRRLLGEFDRHHADDVERLRSFIEADEREAARRLVHTLKGVAGNLGAASLQRLARQVEEQLPGPVEAALLDALAHEHRHLCGVLAGFAGKVE